MVILKTIFFSPFAGIWEHSLIEFGLASRLEKFGHEIKIIRCSTELVHKCVVQDYLDIPFAENNKTGVNACSVCVSRGKFLSKHFNLTTLNLDDFIDDEEREKINSELRIFDIENWEGYKFKDLNLGKMAAYELFIKYKLRDRIIPSQHQPEYIASLKSSILTAIGMQKIINSLKPDNLIVYNSLYSANNVASKVANSYGVKTFTLHAGPNIAHRLNSLTLSSQPSQIFEISNSKSWDNFKKSTPTDLDFSLAFDHLQAIRRGSDAFTYSVGISKLTSNEVHKKIGSNPKLKTFVLTLSSEDEDIALNLVGEKPNLNLDNPIFGSQIEWIEWVINNFKKNQNRQLIIRVHPREFPNKRESITAQNVEILRNIFINLTPNIHINWPDQKISIYNLMEVTDAVLNWRSSVGSEFLAMGFQVISVAGSGLIVYPQELNHVVNSELEFEMALNKIPELNINQTIEIWKWFEFQSRRFSIAISPTNLINYDKFRPNQNQQLLKIWKLGAKIFVKFFPTVLNRKSAKFWKISDESIFKIHELMNENLKNLSEVPSWVEKFDSYSNNKELSLLLKQINKMSEEILHQVGDQSKIIKSLEDVARQLSN